MKTSELFGSKKVFSLEIFPPKCDDSVNDLLLGLSKLNPDFISVTNGTGDSKRQEKTLQITAEIKNKYGIESVAHLPCINLSEQEAVKFLDCLNKNGIENLLALRGDFSPDTAPNGRFCHASDLINFIQDNYDFNVIAACYPEKHPESKSIDDDINSLRIKADSGATQLITQLFLDNNRFHAFRESVSRAGIHIPIEAGIMPVTSENRLEKMVKLCGIEIPKEFMKIAERYQGDSEAFKEAGIEYSIRQIENLIENDVDGIHLYTMNSVYVSGKIFNAVSASVCV